MTEAARGAQSCNKCGLCLAACPVYAQLNKETTSPRGKVRLGLFREKGELASSPELQRLVSLCMMCGGCTKACPSGVEHQRLFRELRAGLARDCGTDWRKRAFYHLLSHQDRLALAGRLAAMGQGAGLDWLAGQVKLGQIPLARMPRLNPKPFLNDLPHRHPAQGTSLGRVAYFVGCGTNYVYGSTGQAVIQVLTAMGFEVLVPPGQTCCAFPMIAQGRLEQARPQMEKNLALLSAEPVDAVITDCATCGAALAHDYPEVLADLGQESGPARELAAKVVDFGVFAGRHVDRLAELIPARREPIKVTYHAPCHLRHAQNGSGQVEKLLSALPGVDFRPVADAESCCGGGGTFFWEHPDVSAAMANPKVAHAQATGADYWLAGCPGCLMNLGGYLEPRNGLEMLHPARLLASLLAGDSPQPGEV